MSTVFIIGGTSYDVPPMRIKQLRVAWSLIVSVGQAGRSPVDQASDIVGVVSAALGGAPSQDALEDALRIDELPALNDAFVKLLIDSGLTNKSGEAPATVEAEPVSQTGTDSSPSL